MFGMWKEAVYREAYTNGTHSDSENNITFTNIGHTQKYKTGTPQEWFSLEENVSSNKICSMSERRNGLYVNFVAQKIQCDTFS
jgi:hypothetical protein